MNKKKYREAKKNQGQKKGTRQATKSDRSWQFDDVEGMHAPQMCSPTGLCYGSTSARLELETALLGEHVLDASSQIIRQIDVR